MAAWSPQVRAGKDPRVQERSPELLCTLLQQLEQVTTSKNGRMVGLCAASQGEPDDSAQKIPKETGQIRAVGEDESRKRS